MIDPKYNEATLQVAAWLFARMRYGPVPHSFDADWIYDETASALDGDEPDLAILVPATRLFLAHVDFAAVSKLVSIYAESCEVIDNIRELQEARQNQDAA